jgi:hypothetical protein
MKPREAKYWAVFGAHVSALVVKHERDCDDELTDAEMSRIATVAHEVARRALHAKPIEPTKLAGPKRWGYADDDDGIDYGG